MIIGIGLDLIEIDRIEKVVRKHPKFADRVLTPFEKQTYEQLSDKRKIEFLAGRFAAKEAYAKARGTGIGGKLSWQDIEITSEHGKPHIICASSDETVHLTITHTKYYALAQVIIERLSS